MRPEIAALKLKAEPTNNGISGWVASQGKPYYCPDARNDPLNITGASNALSCYTVPLMDLGKVIGVMSIESERPDAFSEDDRATFLEFGQEISAALHTLWLLSTQSKRGPKPVSRSNWCRVSWALPIDDILNHASARYVIVLATIRLLLQVSTSFCNRLAKSRELSRRQLLLSKAMTL